MSDEADIDLGDGGEGTSPAKKGGGKLSDLFSGMLKWILIAVGAVILIVVVVFVTMKLVMSNTASQTSLPVSEEYSPQRELLDWYSAIGAIRTKTSDEIPASVVVNVFLGYKKDDKTCATELTARKVELTDHLRRYFTEKAILDLKPQNEQKLKIEIRNLINDEILSGSKIRDVSFQQLDVIEQ